MWLSMLTMAWRNGLRQKQFTLLNLLGLTMGIAASLFIILFIHDELTYDQFHAKGDRIYRVNQPNIWGDWNETIANTGPNVAVALREEIPEFEEVTRLLSVGTTITRLGQPDQPSVFKETELLAAEDNFFNVFTFPALAGDLKTALASPNQLILTLETAVKYFGPKAAAQAYLGEHLELKQHDGSWKSFVVKAILEDVPNRSHLQFGMLVSLTSYQEAMDAHGWKWIWTVFSTYGLVYPQTDMAQLEEKLQSLPEKWAAPTTERIFNQSFAEFTAGNPWKLDLQPLDNIYIDGQPNFHRFGPTGNPLFVKIFSAIALLILVLSGINFMNLSTARSTGRMKEVGIRKVMGSKRRTIIYQFLLESILYACIAAVLAFLSVYIALPWFNDLTDKEMALTRILEPSFFLGVGIFILLVGLISGSYPAFHMSRFSPFQALKGKVVSSQGRGLRNTLVIFQFTISITLVVCSIFVQKQLKYTSTLDIGIRKEHILHLYNIEQFGFDTQQIKSQLQGIAGFEAVGKTFGMPPNIWSGDRYRAGDGDGQVVQLNNFRTEADYLKLLEVKFLSGRNFDDRKPQDKYKVIVNTSALKALGWADPAAPLGATAIGRKIALASGNEQEFEVIGVVEDFNFNSLKMEIAPLVILHHENDQVWDYGMGQSFYAIRLNTQLAENVDALRQALDETARQLAAVDPSVPFEFEFMDAEFDSTFAFEEKMSTVIILFTIIALFIGGLGLFGLAAFSAERRTKELSIRKVLGANVPGLILTFSWEFTKLIGIAIIIASPVAWYLIGQWLSDFAYRTPRDLWVFVATGIGAIVLALLTIGHQSLVVTLKNPAETLKDE